MIMGQRLIVWKGEANRKCSRTTCDELAGYRATQFREIRGRPNEYSWFLCPYHASIWAAINRLKLPEPE